MSILFGSLIIASKIYGTFFLYAASKTKNGKYKQKKGMIIMRSFVKRIVSAILSVLVISTAIALPAFSADADNLEAAIITAKSKISIPSALTEFDSNIVQTDNGAQYHLNWYSKDSEEGINITINNLGDILYFSSRSQSLQNDGPRFAAYTGEELAEKAFDWLKNINPSWLTDLSLEYAEFEQSSNIYNRNSYINFERRVDEIRFLNDSVSFNVDNMTGEVCYMSSTWTYADNIQSTDGILDENSASEKFFSISPLELVYESDNGGNARLVYIPQNPQLKISADEGKEIKLHRIYATEEAMAADNSAAQGALRGEASSKLTESELKNLAEIDGLLSQDELIELAQNLSNTGLDSAAFNSCSYSRGYSYNGGEELPPSYNASLSFVFNEGTENEYNGYVVLDAQTGELISYHAYSYRRNANSQDLKIAAADAISAAKDFISQNAPDKISDIITPDADDIETGDIYYLNFVRHNSNIPLRKNSISISVDSNSGYICSYNVNWDDNISFDSPDGVISIADAEKAFSENVGFELSYVNSYSIGNSNPEIVLAYGLDSYKPCKIDAKTGECIIDTAEDTPICPTDISGHYAYDEIYALFCAGIINGDADTAAFRPDDAITYRELAAMVSRLKARYHIWELSEITSFMRNNKILVKDEAFAPDEPALRIDGPVYIIRALGFREIAELDNIYNCTFKDADKIPTGKTGYAAIAYGLKIISGDENGYFNPNDNLTRADAAIMIYNYLAR